MHLLCYGALAGGFLSARYLGAPEPAEPLANRSLTKYRLIVEEYGGWTSYQELLAAIAAIGHKHGVTPANVAARWVLERPRVGGAILGFGGTTEGSQRIEENLRAVSFPFDAEDRERLDELCERFPGPRGDIYRLERDPGGRHRAILRTGLHSAADAARKTS